MISSGSRAETVVAGHLVASGYRILDRSWKTVNCEIDIVAIKRDVAYFIEVKYRLKSNQGSGWEYILPKKLKQMEFAAKLWVQYHKWGGDWRLLVADVSGADYSRIVLLEL